MTDVQHPLGIWRMVQFCEALLDSAGPAGVVDREAFGQRFGSKRRSWAARANRAAAQGHGSNKGRRGLSEPLRVLASRGLVVRTDEEIRIPDPEKMRAWVDAARSHLRSVGWEGA